MIKETLLEEICALVMQKGRDAKGGRKVVMDVGEIVIEQWDEEAYAYQKKKTLVPPIYASEDEGAFTSPLEEIDIAEIDLDALAQIKSALEAY